MSFTELDHYAQELYPISDSDDGEFIPDQHDDPQSPPGSPDVRTAKRKSEVSQAGVSVSGRVKRRKKDAADAIKSSNTKSDGKSLASVYMAVKPTKPPNNVRTRGERSQAPGSPEIWAASRAELLAAFPGLKKSAGGLTFINFGVYPTLAWLIEGFSWSQDSWVAGTRIGISTVVAKPGCDVVSNTCDKNTIIKTIDNSQPPSEHLPPTVQPQCVLGTNSCSTAETASDRSAIYYQLDNYYMNMLPESMRSNLSPPFPARSHPNHYWSSDTTACSQWPRVEPNRFLVQNQCRNPIDSSPCTDVGSNHFPRLQTSTSSWSLPEPLEGQLPAEERANFITTRGSNSGDAELITNSPTAPEGVVPEFTTISNYFNDKMPIVVIVGKDSSILPFHFPAECAFAVLGMFEIIDLELKFLEGKQGAVRCKAKLEYLSSNEGQPHPWWMPVAPSVKDTVIPANPSVLVESLEGVPERAWWHCTNCGKLNVRKMLSHRSCSNCSKYESVVPAVVIESARQGNKCSPDFFPFDNPPRTMKLGEPKTWGDRMRVFDYCYEEDSSVVVKHVFTCNFEELQEEATRLFERIQLDVEMGWQEVDNVVAKGPYYSYASPSSCDWTNVPKCVAEARNMMVDRARTYGGESQIEINHIVAIAWSKLGRKKDSMILSQRQPVCVLCLGADADFSIERVRQRTENRDAVNSTNLRTASGKAAKADTLRVNMVHGDIAIFKGDDFHYSLERTGLTIRMCPPENEDFG